MSEKHSQRVGKYLYRHGKGFKYLRRVPLELRADVGRDTWVKTFGSIGQIEAERKRDALLVIHQRLIDDLLKLSPEDRAEVAANGGPDRYSQIIDATEAGIRFVEAASQVTDAVDDDDLLEVGRGQQTAARMRRDVARGRKTLAKVGKGAGILTLHDLWKETSKPRSLHSIESMQRSLERLISVVGDMPPRAVTADHAAAYGDFLEAQTNWKPRTKRKYLEEVKTVFARAASKRVIDGNPFRDIKLARPGSGLDDEDEKEPLQPHHVRAIFDKLPGEHPDFQWVTKLFAYHGGRSGEYAQLRKEDIFVSFGVTVMRLTDKAGTIKNKPSRRIIPLHPACKAFVQYAEAAEGPWIFSFPLWKEGRRGAAYQRRATDFIRKVVGIPEKSLSMHSLRHPWRTLAREIDMPEHISRALMGHTLGKGEHGKYGSPVSFKTQLKWLRKVDPMKG